MKKTILSLAAALLVATNAQAAQPADVVGVLVRDEHGLYLAQIDFLDFGSDVQLPKADAGVDKHGLVGVFHIIGVAVAARSY